MVKNGPNNFVLLVASAEPRPPAFHDIDTKEGDKTKLTVQYGDFSDALTKVVEALNEVRLGISVSFKFL